MNACVKAKKRPPSGGTEINVHGGEREKTLSHRKRNLLAPK